MGSSRSRLVLVLFLIGRETASIGMFSCLAVQAYSAPTRTLSFLFGLLVLYKRITSSNSSIPVKHFSSSFPLEIVTLF